MDILKICTNLFFHLQIDRSYGTVHNLLSFYIYHYFFGNSIYHFFNYTILLVIVESGLLIEFCPCQPKFNDNLLTAEFVHGNADQTKEMFNYDAQLLPIGRGNVPKQNHQSKQHFPPSESLMLNNRSDLIQIRATDRVIQDVRKFLFHIYFGLVLC